MFCFPFLGMRNTSETPTGYDEVTLTAYTISNPNPRSSPRFHNPKCASQTPPQTLLSSPKTRTFFSLLQLWLTDFRQVMATRWLPVLAQIWL